MATCATCQREAGWLKHECDDCKSRREAAEAAKSAADRVAAEQARRDRIDAMVAGAVAELNAKTDAGGVVRLYDVITLTLEDDWLDAAGLDRVRDLGKRGWEVVSMAPHLKQSTNTQFALSAVGFDRGQILVSLAVTASNAALLDDEIRKHYAAQAATEIDRVG